MGTVNLKRLLFVLAPLTLAPTSAPAATARQEDEGFRGRQRTARQGPVRRQLGRQEHCPLALTIPESYAAPYCWSEAGYRPWAGWRNVGGPRKPSAGERLVHWMQES